MVKKLILIVILSIQALAIAHSMDFPPMYPANPMIHVEIDLDRSRPGVQSVISATPGTIVSGQVIVSSSNSSIENLYGYLLHLLITPSMGAQEHNLISQSDIGSTTSYASDLSGYSWYSRLSYQPDHILLGGGFGFLYENQGIPEGTSRSVMRFDLNVAPYPSCRIKVTLNESDSDHLVTRLPNMPMPNYRIGWFDEGVVVHPAEILIPSATPQAPHPKFPRSDTCVSSATGEIVPVLFRWEEVPCAEEYHVRLYRADTTIHGIMNLLPRPYTHDGWTRVPLPAYPSREMSSLYHLAYRGRLVWQVRAARRADTQYGWLSQPIEFQISNDCPLIPQIRKLYPEDRIFVRQGTQLRFGWREEIAGTSPPAEVYTLFVMHEDGTILDSTHTSVIVSNQRDYSVVLSSANWPIQNLYWTVFAGSTPPSHFDPSIERWSFQVVADQTPGSGVMLDRNRDNRFDYRDVFTLIEGWQMPVDETPFSADFDYTQNGTIGIPDIANWIGVVQSRFTGQERLLAAPEPRNPKNGIQLHTEFDFEDIVLEWAGGPHDYEYVVILQHPDRSIMAKRTPLTRSVFRNMGAGLYYWWVYPVTISGQAGIACPRQHFYLSTQNNP